MKDPMTDYQIYGSITVNTKWQIIIPKEARDVLWIKPGDKLLVTSKWNYLLWFMKASNVKEFIEKIQINID